MGELEIRGFGKLFFLFKERQWDNPMRYEFDNPLSARELRDRLNIPAADVEVVFINRSIKPLDTLLEDGDRIAFVPPGVPSIHRFNLGFYEARD